MYRKLGGSFRSEEGFSVIEVVLAAFILFFVLTAVLGLVGTTTNMGLAAKQRTALTNAISSHIEWMRAIDFETLAITGTTPDGVVDAQKVVTVDGFTITIETEISEGVGLTRDVIITATAVREGYNPMEMTFQDVIIRDSKSGVVTMLEAGEGPDVTFIAPCAPDDSVVYGSQVLGTTWSPLYIAARATAVEDDGSIVDLRMYCSDTLLRDGTTTFANYAVWEPGVQTWDQTFRWNTRQVDDNGQETVEDGWRIVRVLATDENGAQGMAERRFYVDNYGPGAPGVPTAIVNSDVQTRVSWPQAMDGTDYAPFYNVRWAQIGASGELGAYTAIPNLTSNVFMHATQPFSRYTAAVAATNYRGEATAYYEIETPYVSRTALDGTSETYYSGSGNRRTAYTNVHLKADEPTFLVSDIQYDVYRVTAAAPPTMSDPPTQEEEDAFAAWQSSLVASIRSAAPRAVDVGPDFVDDFNKRVGNNGVQDAWYYAFKISFTPSGHQGGTPEVIWSDVVGPIVTSTGSETMEHVAW